MNIHWVLRSPFSGALFAPADSRLDIGLMLQTEACGELVERIFGMNIQNKNKWRRQWILD
jgi:hypothetical protein